MNNPTKSEATSLMPLTPEKLHPGLRVALRLDRFLLTIDQYDLIFAQTVTAKMQSSLLLRITDANEELGLQTNLNWPGLYLAV